jgi:hypothetical protein
VHVALIYPPALLKKHGARTRYHLVLPHLFQQKRYRDFYRRRSESGDYIILDNGAAESLKFGNRHLYYVAEEMGVHEIVVPDTLGNANDTIAQGLAFTRYTRSGYRYMMVAQGQDAMECIQTIDMIMTDVKFMYVTCIGIPRLINRNDRHARFKVAKYIAQKGHHVAMEFHFLGATRDLDEVGYLDEIGIGRGIDTSAPIYMGMKGRDIAKNDLYIPRPTNYFELSRDTSLVEQNINTYLDWANYDRETPLPEKSVTR